MHINSDKVRAFTHAERMAELVTVETVYRNQQAPALAKHNPAG